MDQSIIQESRKIELVFKQIWQESNLRIAAELGWQMTNADAISYVIDHETLAEHCPTTARAIQRLIDMHGHAAVVAHFSKQIRLL